MSITYLCSRTNEIIVTLQRPQLTDTSDEQTIRRQSLAAQILKPIEIPQRAIETIDVNAVWNHRDLRLTQNPLRAQLTRHCLRNCNHTRRARECVPVQSIQLKQHVTRRHKLRLAITTRRVSRE